MLIGVIADTHDDWQAIRQAAKIFTQKKIELIIHAGDWTSPFTMQKLRRATGPTPRIVTVFGNNDGDRYNFAKRAHDASIEILGEAGAIEIDGTKIGIYHGTSEILLEAMARSAMFHVVIYGHTHKIDIRKINGTLLLNPGEACGCATEKKTIAILDTKTLQPEIIQL